MKNIFNKFAFFIALSFVFISCGNLTTSENDDSIPQGKGKITISTDLQNGRSVLPTAIEETTTGLKWELFGTKDDEQKTIKSWTDVTDEAGTVTVTAYQSMTSDSGIVIDTGTWDFTLTASNTDGKNVLSATISATINAGENKLNFVMQEATGDKAATGSIEFTLNFPKDVVGNVEAKLFKYENNDTEISKQTLFIDSSSTDNCSFVKYSYPDSAGTTSTDLSAGYYILKIELQQKKGDTTTPTVEPKTINTYSCLIRVAPGLLSQGKYTLTDLAQLYTITYKLNEGTFDSTTSAVPTSYNAYTSFELPEPTREGYEFVGWYTDENLQKLVQLDESNKYKITQDITLYAKWKISWDGLKNQIEKDSGISEFVITEDLTATSTITVSKPFKITSDKNVTITRGNTTGNTSFTDAFFEVESAGNLELEGKENSTITLDGGNANESPILATAPLITSSGNLTLTNCTLQNNKNTSTTPGGAIYISAGKFTMNGGIIGKKITGSDASTGKQSWQDAATDSDFSNYAYAGGGGIYVASGDVTINGGKISYNYTRNPETDCQGKTPENTAAGGGISIVSGSLSLINSEVSYNSGYQGGGIRCYNDNTSNAGTLTLNKTLIKGNTSNPYKGSSFGGGLMVKNFKVTFEETTESTIEQNYSGDGGALFLENTTSTLTNITIQNNSYNPNGYHYGSEVLLWANANVLIDDSNVKIASTEGETRGIFINNNTNTLKLSGGAKLDAPVYLMSGTTVTVAGYLSSNTLPVATITPASYAVGTQVLTADDASLLAQCVDKFALSDETYSIGNDGKISAISLTQDYLKENVKTNTFGDSYYELEAGEYCVSANLTLEYPIQINASGGEVKLYSNADYTISCAEDFDNSANSAMIALPMSAGTLTLGGGEGTLTIDGSGISSLMYLVLSQSTLILQDNCTITNGNVTYTAIYVSAGTFTMTGGTITNIHSTKAASEGYGAGIHVSGSSTVVTVSGGSVCNNYNNGTNSGASIYNSVGNVTVLGQSVASGSQFTQNIVSGSVSNAILISSWDELVSNIDLLEDEAVTTEFLITDDLVATSKIETFVPVKITSSKAITITRDENFKELFFDTYASLEVVGAENAIITFDGNNIVAENSIIKINANLSLTYCNLQNNSNGASLGGGGAIYISESTTSTFLKNCSIINNKAYSGGGIYYGNNGYNNYIENCTFENNSVTAASGTGAGVMLYSGNLYINSISMNSNYLADNETSADLYLYNAKQPEVVLDDVVSIQSLWFYFSSIFPILKVGSNLSGDVKVVLKPSSSSYSVNQLITLDSETVLSNTQIGCFSEIKDASNNYYTLLASGVINKN